MKTIEMLQDYFAWLKHLRHEEMDTATSGLWGYWKREPFYPRARASKEDEQ